MKMFATVLGAGLCLFAIACGSDTGGGGGGTTTNTSTNCSSQHTCINGACTCENGDSCTDDTKCVDECEVCS